LIDNPLPFMCFFSSAGFIFLYLLASTVASITPTPPTAAAGKEVADTTTAGAGADIGAGVDE
jgi:hypothetical protein